MRWVVMASGSGSNLQAMIDAQKAGTLGGEIVAVISDVADARALERARQAGIPAEAVPYRRGERAAWEDALAETIAGFNPDWIALAGFMRILSPRFIARYPYMLNIHPSLLPDYRGLDTHQRVLDAGESRHGTTVHLVNAELDGGPAILQMVIDIGSEDTAVSLMQRIQACEHRAYPAVIRLVNNRRLSILDDRPHLDGKVLDGPVLVPPGTTIEDAITNRA